MSPFTSEASDDAQASILLVDDKPERLLSYEAILEPLGQQLVRASSGEEAIRKLEEMEFAAILLDVNMPGMDGFETAHRIRSHPMYGQTPIIFVTGVHITDLDRLRGYEMGAADYVYVPVVPEILRSKVHVLVQLYRQKFDLARLNQRLAVANEELARAHARLQAENTRELQKLNRTLEQANQQLLSEVAERKRVESLLRDAARRKDEFISILAHELRNPLAAMQSGVELLKDEGGRLGQERQPWVCEVLERQLAHLKRLIDDLLDVSRVTSGQIQIHREPVELETLIAHSLELARSLIDERQHHLSVELPEQPLHVDGDAVRLTQVFGNLLTNAAKFTDIGGSIALKAETDPAAPGWVRVCVSDTGHGIPEEMLERVFELFAQGSDKSRGNDTGLGIGLALARGLVEMHGGTIRASSPGRGMGSEFVVCLPMSEAVPTARTPLPTQVEAPAVQPRRLLIIDDNVDFASGLAAYLGERSGHEVRVAHSGLDGVGMALDFRPDVVVLDIGLPDIDGYEVARRLRSRLTSPLMLIVGVSGFGSQDHRNRAQLTGFDRYLIKPLDYDVLNDLLAPDVPPSADPPIALGFNAAD